MELKPFRPNLRECPFCGSTDLHVIDNAEDFFVGCDGCAVCGPSGDTPMDAVEAWNRRVGEGEKE